ncbi:zinc finger protein 714-like [Anoplophora glabripennis]|uniref:zinc finger protein 714-like n=1 Tax=Anoplophora glabripennis TaxID=217634 RepID=UPI00087583B9|nr:zinc finger protein 714-like [Anoplophora glabripennis]
MTGVQAISCRLCLKSITDKSFVVVGSVTRDILDVFMLKLKLDTEGKEFICNACRRQLYAAVDFKSACVKTDTTIIPYVDWEKMLQLDLREVYIKEKGNELVMDVSDIQKICRLCMQPVNTEFTCIGEEQLEAIEKLVPEININIIKDPVVCKPCFDSVCIHNSFLKNCLEVEEKIRGIIDSSTVESKMDTSPSDLFIKTENLDKEFDVNEMEMSIKVEIVDIKSEDEERSDTHNSNNEPFEESVCKDVEEDGCKLEIGSEKESVQEHKVLYKCDKCVYETGSTSSFAVHCAKHENCSEAYKCESCKFETENEKLLQWHRLRHKSLELLVHRCKSCNYKTKHKSYLAKHQVKHKSASTARLYKCGLCDFKTKWRSSFNNHYKKHKDSIKCDECDCKTKYSALLHEGTSQQPNYKCNRCDCKSKDKKLFTSQLSMHKAVPQVKIYKCNNCDHETKHKGNIKLHQLRHKDPSQVQTCNDCDYEAKYRSNIKQHQLKHKDPSQAKMDRCDNCGYKTICKRDMKRHQLKHKMSSHVQM